MTPSGRNTGAAANKEGRETRSGIFAAPPSGLVIGLPPHAGVGKAAAWSNRAATLEARGTSYLRPQTPEEAQAMTEDDMRWLAVTPFKGELEATTPLEGMKAVKGRCDEWQEAAYCADVSTTWWAFFFTSLVIDEYFSCEGTWGWKMDFGFRRMKLTRKNLSAMPERMTGYMVALGMVIALDKKPDKTPDTSLTNTRDISADKKPAILPQSLQSPSEVLVDAAIAKQKAAKGTSRLDELKDGIRDGVAHYDERKNESGEVLLFDDIVLGRNSVAFVVRHPATFNVVVVAVPGRDGAPELCKDITDELTVFLMRIRDGQKKLQHPALVTVNEPEVKPAVAAKPYTPPPARPPRQGYPAWLVREYAGIGPLETL